MRVTRRDNGSLGILGTVSDEPRPRPGDPPPVPSAVPSAGNDQCEVCGSDRVSWRNCKLLCSNCRSIVKSCADL
jgi:hypothetical protein